MPNFILKGKTRMEDIIADLDTRKSLRSDQIAARWFTDVKPEYRLNKCDTVLRHLYDQERINRHQFKGFTSYVYFPKGVSWKSTHLWETTLVNDVVSGIQSQYCDPPYRKILDFKITPSVAVDNKAIYPDAWFKIQCSMSLIRCLFFEYEDEKPKFAEHVKNYDNLYKTRLFKPWAVMENYLHIMPLIVVACETEAVKNSIIETIKKVRKEERVKYVVATAALIKTNLSSLFKEAF